MKKILLATTMLVAGASIAAAEVTLSGDARMGIISGFDDPTTTVDEGDVGFTSRARVKFTLSGESDAGLSFGGSFRADNAGGAASGTAGSVFVSGAFGKLSMGDVDGAALSAVGHIDGVGLTGLGDLNESLYLGNGGLNADSTFGTVLGALTADPTALYEYSAGSFSVYASVTQPNYVVGTNTTTAFEGDAYAVGAKYSMDAYSFAVGYEKLDASVGGASVVDLDHIIASASGSFSNVTVKATYGTADGVVSSSNVDFKQYGLSATYKMDALSLTAFANQKDLDLAGVPSIDLQAVGLGGSYDLGGGASVVGGVVRAKEGVTGTSETSYDLGLSFAF